jgi:hypothetical protein
MVARRRRQRQTSSSGADVITGGAAQLASDDASAPLVEPIDDTTRSGADLPAERDQNRDRDQRTSDHDGNGNTHAGLWNIDGRNKAAITLFSPVFSQPVERYLPRATMGQWIRQALSCIWGSTYLRRGRTVRLADHQLRSDQDRNG